jgi:hypothetical protein
VRKDARGIGEMRGGPMSRRGREQAREKASFASFLSENPELRFAWDTLKKVFVFVIIALSAAGIHKLVEILEYSGTPPTITLPLTFVEYVILLLDVIWFVHRLVIENLELLTDLLTGPMSLKLVIASILFTLGALFSSPLKDGIVALLRTISTYLQVS